MTSPYEHRVNVRSLIGTYTKPSEWVDGKLSINGSDYTLTEIQKWGVTYCLNCKWWVYKQEYCELCRRLGLQLDPPSESHWA